MTGQRDAPGNQPDADGHRTPHFRLPLHGRRIRPDGGSDPGRDRHRILRELRGELARHPAVRSVAGDPPDEYRELRATLNPSWFSRATESASLRVTWIPDPSPGPEASERAADTWKRTPVRAYYTLHYSEPNGLDCGYHCEPNPHVDGLLHYQERTGTDSAYVYEPVSFGARSVSGLLWEMMDALDDRLGDPE